MSAPFDFDVFLSHSSKDKPVIRKLADKLSKDGVRVWLDERIMQPGDSIPLAIKNGLATSRVLAICWSKNYAESEWGQFEANTFLFRDPNNRDRRFVPLRLDDHEIEESLRQYLYIDYRKKAKKEYERLRDHCRPPEAARPIQVEATPTKADGEANRVFSLGHTNAVRSVAFSPSGQHALSGSDDNTVRLWDARRGNCLRVLEGHTAGVNSVAWSADGQAALSGSDDHTVRLWDARTGKCIRVFKGHTGPVWSVAWSADGQEVLSGSDDHTVRLWDARTGRCLVFLLRHAGGVRSVVWSADGQLALSGSADRTLRLWEARTETCVRVLEGHTDRVTSVAWSPDRQQVLSGSDDKTVRVWDTTRGQCIRILEGHAGRVTSVAWSADGQQAVSGSADTTVRLWDATTGQCIRILEGHTDRVTSVAWSPDRQQVLSGSDDKTVRVWDTTTGECLRVMEGHTHNVERLAWSANGQQVLSASDDTTLRLWDLATGCLGVFIGHTGSVWSVAWSMDGQQAISGSADKTLRLWDVRAASCLWIMLGHTGPVTSVAWSPDGQHALSGSLDKTVRLWDARTGKCLRILEGHTDNVWSVGWSRYGQEAISSSADKTIRLWDATTGKCLRVLEGHTGRVESVAWSPDGEQALSGSADNTVRLWNATTGKCLRVLEGHTDRIESVAWSAHGQQALSGSADNTVRLWDTHTGNCLRVLEGHTAIVMSVAWSADGKRVLSAAANGVWRVWDLARGVQATPEYLNYTNAKVLMVGESGVGKTGLSNYLARGIKVEVDKPLPSTDAHQTTRVAKEEWATRLPLPHTSAESRDEQEIWLWDFAGQPDYRLVHRFFMDETALAVLVFNPQSKSIRDDIATWDTDLCRASRRPFKKLLVAGRCDVGGLTIPQTDLETIGAKRGFSAYLETSAASGAGCEELKRHIVESIDWQAIPHRSSPRLYKVLKEEIVRMRDAGQVLLRLDELRQQLQLRLPSESFTPEQLRAVVGLLAGPGLIRELEFGDFVLLQPEWINRYAAAVTRSIRDRVDDMGTIEEEKILKADLKFESMERLPPSQEEIVLLAMRQILVQYGICFAEKTDGGTQLIFPSLYKQERPQQPDHPPLLVSYRVEGNLKEIYATLIAHLYYSKIVENAGFWFLAADFKTAGDGRRLGLKMTPRQEANGEIGIYFDRLIDINTKVAFLRYVDEHLKIKALKIERTRHYVCEECGSPAESATVQRRLADMKSDIICSGCEKNRIVFHDAIEQRFESPEVKEQVRQLDRLTQAALDNESKELILVGEVFSVAGRAGQIFRPTPNSDHGVDGEIEFKNPRGQASGKKIYVQLKSGDSYLRKRKADDVELFEIKKERWAEYWQSLAYDVWLIIRTSDGRIRGMNATDYLRNNASEDEPVKHIVFEAVKFDEVMLLRLRDELVTSAPG
jgi:WD40 repeat protein/GTPase SAR1 family protein